MTIPIFIKGWGQKAVDFLPIRPYNVRQLLTCTCGDAGKWPPKKIAEPGGTSLARSIPRPADTDESHSTNSRNGSTSWWETWHFHNSAGGSASCQDTMSDRWGPQVHHAPKPKVLGVTRASVTLLYEDCCQEKIQVEIADLGFVHLSLHDPLGTHPTPTNLQSSGNNLRMWRSETQLCAKMSFHSPR